MIIEQWKRVDDTSGGASCFSRKLTAPPGEKLSLVIVRTLECPECHGSGENRKFVFLDCFGCHGVGVIHKRDWIVVDGKTAGNE